MHLEPTIASRVLSRIVQKLLPQPEGKSIISNDIFSEEFYLLVLKEAMECLKIQPNDKSIESRTKLFIFLSGELSKLALNASERREARARLGDRGDLNLELYKINFGISFNQVSNYGVRRSHVESSMRKPDNVQHLVGERFDQENRKNISLFSTFKYSNQIENSFYLFVEAVREDDQLNVISAWRIYPSDVDTRDTRFPLDLLKAFVNVYGLEFRIADYATHKFLIYDAFPFQAKARENKLIEILNASNDDFYQNFFVRISTLNVLEVSMAYCINLTKYAKDLMKHGVHITP